MTISVKAGVRLAVIAVAAMNVAACATVTRGTKQDFRVESTPPNARVSTSHGYTCTTPCTLKLPRKDEFEITLSLDGYKPFRTHIGNEISGGGAAGLAGNVIVGGVIGIGVDAVTGASLDLRPNPLVVEMAPVDSAEESRIGAPAAPAAAGGN